MQEKGLRILLDKLQNKEITVDEAVTTLKQLPFKDLGFAKVDVHRELRQNHPEVVFCQGKTPEQVKEIVQVLAEKSKNVLATRADAEQYAKVLEAFPEAKYFKQARIILINEEKEIINQGKVLVVSAGTSDLPVAEEAVITLEAFGNNVERLYDVGVAGLHRLLAHLDKLEEAKVIIVVAGMEGALASVVGGLVNKPVIAVPTSIGYGASFNGLAALLAMLNSCAAGVAVCNIDNGFGAARLASLINGG